MLKSFKSVNFDPTLSGVQKFAAACLLAALLPVQGHAATALSKQPGLMQPRVQQTESAAPGKSKQDTLGRQGTGAARSSTLGGKQNTMDRVNKGATGAAATVKPSAKSEMQSTSNAPSGQASASSAKLNAKLQSTTQQRQQLQNSMTKMKSQ
jgi:hypothetical protein